MYYRYVVDTFAIFDSENDCDEFHQLNSLHPLQFTFEKQLYQSFPLMYRWKRLALNLLHLFTVNHIYRQYLNWKSFSPGKKISLISTLLHRVLMICSDVTLQAELRKKFLILFINGYPDHVIEKTIAHELRDFTSATSHTVLRRMMRQAVRSRQDGEQ